MLAKLPTLLSDADIMEKSIRLAFLTWSADVFSFLNENNIKLKGELTL